jgi:hypothetical protein
MVGSCKEFLVFLRQYFSWENVVGIFTGSDPATLEYPSRFSTLVKENNSAITGILLGGKYCTIFS